MDQGRSVDVRAAGLDRRRFLALTAAGSVALPALAAEAAANASAVPSSRRRMIQMNGYATDAETPLDALSTYLTPNDLFFVRHHWNPMYPDLRNWALEIDGEVDRPLRLTIAELKRMPRSSVTCVLQCAGNGRALHRPRVAGVQWSYGAVGNARWTGVRVRDLLERAKLKATARHLHTSGSDKPPASVPPFARSVELEKILADGIVADEMNGEPLPRLHGAPARLVVPGWAGDHWMKWLSRLSARPEPQKGFYMETAYRYPRTPGEPGVAVDPKEMSPVTELLVKSNITDAPSRVSAGAAAIVRGFAFSGAPDVAKVEVTDDDGKTWTEAELGTEHDPYAWRLWSFRYVPRRPGRVTLRARATDSRGSVQPREAVWNQSGYLFNGWHAVEIEVTA
jgi:DMSO/TMAO reductase YedYZ molybdopterin-dependent catalytic subunit